MCYLGKALLLSGAFLLKFNFLKPFPFQNKNSIFAVLKIAEQIKHYGKP